MYSLKITLLPYSDSERASGTLVKQRLRNDTWVNEEEIVIVSGDPGAERTMVLDDSQRIIMGAKSTRQVVFDKGQMAAVPGDHPAPAPTPLSTDGDEVSDTPNMFDKSLTPNELRIAREREARDRAITEARLKMDKEKNEAFLAAQEAEKQRTIAAEKARAESHAENAKQDVGKVEERVTADLDAKNATANQIMGINQDKDQPANPSDRPAPARPPSHMAPNPPDQKPLDNYAPGFAAPGSQRPGAPGAAVSTGVAQSGKNDPVQKPPGPGPTPNKDQKK
jgi:hypothetical protein